MIILQRLHLRKLYRHLFVVLVDLRRKHGLDLLASALQGEVEAPRYPTLLLVQRIRDIVLDGLAPILEDGVPTLVQLVHFDSWELVPRLDATLGH